MQQRIRVVALMIVVFSQTSAVNADETGELRELIQNQHEQLQQLQQRLDELEVKQKRQNLETEEKISEAVKSEQIAALPDSLKWFEKIKISGDFRYRHEHIDSERIKEDGSIGWRNGRDRNRIRARLMIEAMVNNEWDFGLRLATGETDVFSDNIVADPVSTNQTLTEFGSHKDFWLDLAYFDYHPESMEGLNVVGGKIKNPYYKVGKNQLVWDDDLNPEGVAAKYTIPVSDSAALHCNGGGYWLNEESSDADTSLWGIQAYLKQGLSNSDYLLAGAGFYDYGNLQGLEDELGIGLGNTLDPVTDEYVNDYDILEVLVEYGTKVGELPVAVFGTWVENTVAVTTEDTGWLVGGKLGKAKEPGSMEFVYDYRDVERDAVLAAWNDSDFNAGLTGGKGHRFGLTYQLVKNVQYAMTYFHNENTLSDSDLDYRRLQADLKLKF